MNGDRHYRLDNWEVILQKSTVETMQSWNKEYKTCLFDAKYLKLLAMDVLGIECLAESSVFGRRARNSKIQRVAFDKPKMKFMQGNDHCNSYTIRNGVSRRK